MNKTASLVWEYIGAPELYSVALGFAHRLPNEHTLMCFGISRHILETDIAGQTRWKVLLDKPDFYPYRAFRIPSLY